MNLQNRPARDGAINAMGTPDHAYIQTTETTNNAQQIDQERRRANRVYTSRNKDVFAVYGQEQTYIDKTDETAKSFRDEASPGTQRDGTLKVLSTV